jgi:translation initiation factor IF-3
VDPDDNLDPAILGPGTHIGVMSRSDAQRKAKTLGMDLVEVSPNADPPVVRVMDFGKFLFEEKKTKKKQKIQKLKEIKFRPVTDEGDYQVKLRNLLGFLEDGDKVKVTIRFKGREITHKELGSRLLDRIKADILKLGVVDQEPKLEGRQMVMVISPKK